VRVNVVNAVSDSVCRNYFYALKTYPGSLVGP
jgi:hypothetical protein